MNTFLLVAAALLPAVILCIYIFKKDRAEKEPMSLLLKLLVFGALICIPAAIIETMLMDIIDLAFSPFAYIDTDGTMYLSDRLFKLYNIVDNFIGIALVEEGLKWLVLILATRKNQNFSHLFDGLIYSVFVSLGFAALENIMYVTEYGFINAVTRAIFSVPGHMFFAVLMGYYYSLWHISDEASGLESLAASKGLIYISNPFKSTSYIAMSIVMPILAHGFYDYCCTSESGLSTALFYIFIIFLYIYCFGKIKKMSKADASDDRIASAMLIKKYPEILVKLRLTQQ